MAATNSFGTFLDTTAALRGRVVLRDDTARANPVVALSLLDGSFPVTVTDLVKRSGMPLPAFADALEELLRAEAVTVTPTDSDQLITLTARGALLKPHHD